MACLRLMTLLALVTCSAGMMQHVFFSRPVAELPVGTVAAAQSQSPVGHTHTTHDDRRRAERVNPEITAGTDVPDGLYPFVVALLDVRYGATAFQQQICGGALITPRYVLTAAHCLGNGRHAGSNLRVAIGRTVLDSSQGDIVPVRTWVRHRGFDIAVIQLEHPVEGIQTIPMVAPGDTSLETPGTSLIVAGWGDTVRRPGHGNPLYADRLEAATVPARSDDECQRAYRRQDFDPASDVCAGGTGTDACFGDSGGPLFTATGGWRLVGILSGGHGCGTKIPSIYTQVSSPTIAGLIQQFIDQMEAS